MTTIENNLNLTIQPRKNILDGITLYEPVDLSILDKLINSTLLKDTFNNPVCTAIYTNEKLQLTKYRELIENNRATIKYDRYKTNPFGRSNPKKGLGLFSIRREIRHTLAKDNFEDVDIDNAHPSMLEQILTYNNIECPKLQDYIKNRQSWFDLVKKHYKIEDMQIVKDDPTQLKDIPKNLFIRILFGGGVNKWKTKYGISETISTPSVIKEFVDEVKTNNEIIANNNPDLVDIIKKVKLEQGKKEYNINGSVCSYFLQEKEIIILEQIFMYCKSKDYIKNDNVVLCADGLMIEKRLYKPELLKQLNILVKLKTGFDLNFSNKPMNQDYLKVLDKNLNFDLYHPTFTSGLLANYFRIIYSNKYLNYNGQVYIYTGVYWKKEEDKKNSTLHNFVDTTFYKHLVNYISEKISKQNKLMNETDDEELLKQLSNELDIMTKFLNNINTNLRGVKKRREIVDDIINKITNNFVEFDNNPFVFSFTNKIYNLQNGEWIEPRYNQYITLTTGWDWCDYYPKELKQELDAVVDTIFTAKNVKEYYLLALSTGLYGQQIEKIFIANGAGGNGKSLINALMMTSVGNYGYKLPSNVLLNEIKQGANPEVANMHKMRFCLTQEPDGRKRICASTLKEITGDPTLNCRTLYSSNTKTILELSLFLECNDLPKMDEVNDGVQRRTEVIPFESKFVEKALFDEFTEEERKERKIMLGNSFYKTDEFKQKYKQALIEILFDSFKSFRENNYNFISLPKECREKAKDYLATSDNIFSWFSEYYEKEDDSDSKTNFIYISDLYKTFTTSDYWNNLSKSDRRDMNEKSFIKKINENLFIQPHIKKRDTKYAGIKHKKDYIINYKELKKKSPLDFDDETDSESFDI